jgi:hypothetical protein
LGFSILVLRNKQERIKSGSRNIIRYICEIRIQWCGHVLSMDDSRIPLRGLKMMIIDDYWEDHRHG